VRRGLLALVLAGCTGSASTSDESGDALRAEVEVRCDVVAQDCVAGTRCDFFCERGRVVIGCLAETSEAVALGDMCRGQAGGSNCMKGTGCFASSAKPQSCHRYCREGSVCPDGTACDTASVIRAGCSAGSADDIPVHVCR
jgi:hypothetical protein